MKKSMRKQFTIRVVPRSSQVLVEEKEDGSLRVKLSAPPVDGEANKQLIQALATHFGIAKSRIRVTRGLSGRNKIIEIE